MRGAIGLAVLAVLVLPAGTSVAQDCAEGVVDLRDGDLSARFQVEVRDTVAGRAEGLMNRESLPRNAGMLFVYPEAGPVSFWMRNTLIPLDMLFFDAAGRLQRIHENAVPLDETPIPGGMSIRYVLEINAGLAGMLDIEEGAELRSPATDQSLAAWPCG